MGGKRIAKEIKQKALELFQQGFSYKATSSQLSLKQSTVNNWYLLFRSGDTSWATAKYRKTNIGVLQRAVDEYLNTEQGYKTIAVKYGISPSTLLTAKRNFVNYGVVQLPRGRNSMQCLQEQKQKIKKELQSVEEHKEPMMNKKELKEMRELLVVNMALLEVLEESHPEELKKKRIQAAKKAAGGKISLRRACAILQVNRSSVYKSLKPSKRDEDDRDLAEKMREIQCKHQGCYGIDRMTGELRRQGLHVNHKRIARIMKLYKLNAVIRKKRNYFCAVEQVPRRQLPKNLLARKFHADKPGPKLVSDVTYLSTADGQWCYASLVKDLCTSEIVACVTGRAQNLDFGLQTLKQLKDKIQPGAVFHTDQGCLYTHPIFSRELKNMGVVQSLSRKGNCLDNAVIESFNGTMKSDRFYPQLGKGRWKLSFDEVSKKVFEYVKYYNEERIQKKLGYLTPSEYRHQITQNQ